MFSWKAVPDDWVLKLSIIVGSYRSTTTFVPILTRPERSTTSWLVIRMQPEDTAAPIVSGSFEP